MNEERVCKFEAAVLATMGNEPLPEELRDHLKSCEECRETLAMARRLRELAAHTESVGAAFEARRIWLKAQLQRQQDKSRRFERIVPITAAAFTILSVIAASILGWSQIEVLFPQVWAPVLVGGAVALALLFTDELVVS